MRWTFSRLESLFQIGADRLGFLNWTGWLFSELTSPSIVVDEKSASPLYPAEVHDMLLGIVASK
jgi:hypothetical protein